MTTWFTSDLHFGHKNIIKYCNRPWTVDKAGVAAMDEELIANWNAVVRSDDVVWNLGDLAFCTSDEHALECLTRLNGVHELIPGNHDEIARRVPFGHWNDSITETTVEGQQIVLSHYAMRTWHHAQRGVWHLFGHTHALLRPFGKSVDVGVDNVREVLMQLPGDDSDYYRRQFYRPVSFAELKAFMDMRAIGAHEMFGEGFDGASQREAKAALGTFLNGNFGRGMSRRGNDAQIQGDLGGETVSVEMLCNEHVASALCVVDDPLDGLPREGRVTSTKEKP